MPVGRIETACRFGCGKTSPTVQGAVAHERTCKDNPNPQPVPGKGMTRGRIETWAKKRTRTFSSQDVADALTIGISGARQQVQTMTEEGVLVRDAPDVYRYARVPAPAVALQSSTTTARSTGRPIGRPRGQHGKRQFSMVDVVRTAVDVGGEVRNDTLRTHLGMTAGGAGSALRRGQSDGYLRRRRQGLYAPTPKGLALLNGNGNGNGNGHVLDDMRANVRDLVRPIDAAFDAASPATARTIRTRLADDARVASALEVLFPKGLSGVNVGRLIEWVDITREFIGGE